MNFKLFVLLVILICTNIQYQMYVTCVDFDQLCPEVCDCYYERISWITDCSHNNLTEIPYHDVSVNVTILNLESNSIRVIEPFPNDLKLRKLDLNCNHLTTISLNSFQNLQFLVDIDLSNNFLEFIHSLSFSAIPGLLSLKLSSNRLHVLNEHFLISNSLMYLDLRNCSITQIDKKAFENITSLNTLDISMNTLTKLDSEIFNSLISLEILEMNDCNLTDLNENLFRNLSNLKTLKMNVNNFQSVTNWFLMFAFLNRLEHLELKSSKLQFLSKNSISEISYLRTLKLSDNNLKNVNFNEILGKHLQNLEILDLSDCHLNKNFTKDSFRNIDQLRELNLSGNNEVDNISEILKYLTNLEKLILRNAGLKRLPNVFHDLVELDVSYNHLDNNFTATLVDFDKLQYLNMAYCNLTLISANTFRKMSSMTHLILSGNNLKSLGFDLFQTLPNLESLELNNCQFEGPLNGKLAQYENHVPFTHLKQLYLSKNPLKIIQNDGPLLPKQFSRLELLDISYCNISFLPKNAFSFTPNITKLKLNGNKLNSNQNNSFDYLMFLPHLEELDLTNNRLKTFFHHKIQNKSKITKLTFFDNPWNCDLFICDLFQWLKKQDQNLFAFQMHPKNLSCYNKNNHYRRSWIKYVRDTNCTNNN